MVTATKKVHAKKLQEKTVYFYHSQNLSVRRLQILPVNKSKLEMDLIFVTMSGTRKKALLKGYGTDTQDNGQQPANRNGEKLEIITMWQTSGE